MAREQMKQAQEAEYKFARIREEMAGLSVSGSAGGTENGRTSPPRKQPKREEGESMPDATPPSVGVGSAGRAPHAQGAASSGSAAPGPVVGPSRGVFGTRTAPGDRGDVNPKNLRFKGVEKAYAEVYLRKRVEDFLEKVGIVSARHDVRVGQNSVKLAVFIAAATGTAMQS